jgi:hypothetical protein
MRRILIIGFILLIGLYVMVSPVLAITPYEPGTTGWKIKEIIWDAGWIWVIMLVMGLALIFDIIRGIIQDARGGPDAEEEQMRQRKPSYEVIIRKRIE